MSYAITHLEHTFKLTINGSFVGAYNSIDEIEMVLNAYCGRI